jgi:hypothetical protein
MQAAGLDIQTARTRLIETTDEILKKG